MARKRLVTTEEAVLIHLLEYTKHSPEDTVPMEMTQAGISRALGVRRSHVSISLDTAISRSTVEEHLSRVRGEKRRRKCYFLTATGIESARGMRKSVASAPVISELADGTAFEGSLDELVTKLEGRMRLPCLALLVLEGKARLPEFPGREESPVAASRVPHPGRLYGRTEELAAVNNLLQGKTRVMTITGMPGIGKTSLAAYAASQNKRGNVFWYSVTDWSSPRNACNHLASFLGAMGSPRLGRYLEAHEIPDLADVQDILERERSRSVLIFDDCQRASQSMQLFLAMLTGVCTRSDHLGLGLLGRRMPETIGSRLAPGSGISLKPLDSESSLTLLRERGIPDKEATKIARKGGGHPMYLSLAETADGGPGSDVSEMLAREIYSALSEAENQIMMQMSVFRENVSAEALAETREDIEALESLKARSLLTHSGGWSMHSLLADFYYSRMPPAEKDSRHERAAEYYGIHDLSMGGQVEQIYHLFMARDYESAALGLGAKGEELLAHGYTDETMALCSMAPESWRKQNGAFPIRYLEASALDLTGRWDEAADIYRACIDVARELSDVESEAKTLRSLGAIEYRKGNLAEARKILERALAMLSGGPSKLTAELHGSLGVVLWKMGDTEAARKSHATDLDLSESGRDKRGISRALNNLGILDWQSHDSTSALEKYSRALTCAEKLGDNRLIAILYSNMGDVHRSSGNLADARRYYERCLQLAEDLKFNWQVAEAYRGLADAVPEKRNDFLSRALNIFERLGAAEDAKAVRKMMSLPTA